MSRDDSVQKTPYRVFPTGLTVTELKALIRDWPETDANGEPCEVWMETGENLSGMVCSVVPLNYRVGEDGRVWADVLFGRMP